jgi:hypothetical protein
MRFLLLRLCRKNVRYLVDVSEVHKISVFIFKTIQTTLVYAVAPPRNSFYVSVEKV